MKQFLFSSITIMFLLTACSSNVVFPHKAIKLTPVEKLPEYILSRNSLTGEESDAGVNLPLTLEQKRAAAEHVQTQLDILMDECRPILSGFEEKTEIGARNAFWLSMAGLVSGSIIAPALTTASPESNAVWISALSSFGGASNIMSKQLENAGMSGTHTAQERNEIINRIREQLEVVFSNTDNPEKQLIAMARAKSECGLYTLTVPSIVGIAGDDNSPQPTTSAAAPAATTGSAAGDDNTAIPLTLPASTGTEN